MDIDSTEILVLKHTLDGYHEVTALFDQDPSKADDLNAMYGQSKYFNNYFFDRMRLWFDVGSFIKNDDSYMATWIRKEQDPEYAEYLRLKEKFK